MSSKSAWANLIDPVNIIGIFISLVLSFLLYVNGEDTLLAIIFGLTTTTITLIIDIQMKMRESEITLGNQFKTARKLANVTQINNKFQSILDDYVKIRQKDSEWFDEILDDKFGEFSSIVHNLSEGTVVIPASATYSFRRKGIAGVRKSMRMVQFDDPSYWIQGIGNTYLDEHRRAIRDRNVDVVRIWIQPQKILQEYKDIILKHVQIGMKVYIVEKDRVISELCKDFGIVDDDYVISPLPNNRNEEKISIIMRTVIQAKKDFETLKRQYASEAVDYFSRL